MKIPKNFVPSKKKTDKIAKKLLNKSGQQRRVSDWNLKELILDYEEFLSVFEHTQPQKMAVTEDYSKYDLQAFCDRLAKYEKERGFWWTGMYLSELINKVIKENEEIRLKLPPLEKKLDYIGNAFKKGTLIIEGDLGDITGHLMSGGKIIVHGGVGKDTGHAMCGGEIHAKKIASISAAYLKGEIYENGKKRRPVKW